MTNSLIIQEDTIISDIATTNIEVLNSSTLTVYGIVNGQITIDKLSNVIIHGMVNGDIINKRLSKFRSIVY